MSKPSHSQQELLERVYAALVVAFPDSNVEPFWREATGRFIKWLGGLPAPTSQLDMGLYLVELLCEYFDAATLKTDQNLIQIVLGSTLETNNYVDIGGTRYEVIRREIGDNFGVSYTLKNEKGEMLRHEFFD